MEKRKCRRQDAGGITISIVVRIEPVGRRCKVFLRHGSTRHIVDHHLHVLVAESLDLLDHVRIGIATLAVTKRETNGWRWPLFMAGYMFVLAYLVAFITYEVSSALIG